MKAINALLIFLAGAHCTPIIIRTGGGGTLSEQSSQHGGDVFGVNSRLGMTNFESDAGFDRGSEKKTVQAADAGKFSEDEGNRRQDLDQGAFGAVKFHNADGGAVSDYGKKAAHNKGHQKSGFHNTYHKDESGSNSSYFDDASDHGKEYNHDTRKNNFGDSANKKVNGNYLRGDSYNRENGRRGGYNNGGHHEKDQENRRQYNREQYQDNHRDYGRNNAGRQFGNSGKRFEEEYHDGQHFQPNHRHLQRPYDQRITIYEDPAYGVHERRGYLNRYYDDGLDIRPPTVNTYHERRYYDRRPNYDYYY